MTRLRKLAAVVCGFAAGWVVGTGTVWMNAASDTLVRGWHWPEMDGKFFLLLALSAIPAAVNGAVGAALAGIRNNRGRLGISVLPVGLHLIALPLVFVDRDSFLLGQLVALMFSVMIWTAGRLGQSIGSAFRRGEAAAEKPAAVAEG